MKKCVWLAILTVVVLLIGSIGSAMAEILPARGAGQIGYDAEVLCESLTIRQERSAYSKETGTLHYGDFLIVMEVKDGWALCVLSDDVDAAPVGWVNADYIAIDPAWYRTDKKTPVYAWNSGKAPKVALLDAGTTLTILKEEGDWVVVSLRGASGWIHKSAGD